MDDVVLFIKPVSGFSKGYLALIHVVFIWSFTRTTNFLKARELVGIIEVKVGTFKELVGVFIGVFIVA